MKIDKSKIALCTYFDKNYLLKGLNLYESLEKHNPGYTLWVLCFDGYTKKILDKLKLKNVKTISLSEFEDDKLKAIKNTRSKVEYIWTCTPSLPLYVFKKDKKVNKVVYLDGDLFFFSSFEPAIKELGRDSIYTVEHRYPPDQMSRINTSGRFNVGFQIFKRDKEAFRCLRRWRNQCLDWCYWRLEDGKLGDQLYLNEWPDLYKNLVISENLGVNAAPWNVGQYKVTKRKDGVYINNDKLICYHFHQFQILGENKFSRIYGYTPAPEVIELIYKPYEREIKKQIEKVKKMDKSFRIVPPKKNIVDESKRRLIKFMGPLYWKVLDFLKWGKKY